MKVIGHDEENNYIGEIEISGILEEAIAHIEDVVPIINNRLDELNIDYNKFDMRFYVNTDGDKHILTLMSTPVTVHESGLEEFIVGSAEVSKDDEEIELEIVKRDLFLDEDDYVWYLVLGKLVYKEEWSLEC